MNGIPLYPEINDFLAAAGFRQRAGNPNLIIIRLEDTYPDVRPVMPPFRKGFFLLAMAQNDGGSEFRLDDQHVRSPKTYLVFQSPGHILSWRREEGLSGYLVYFKEGCFSFFRQELMSEFPFFGLLHTNFFHIETAVFKAMQPDFEELLSEQSRSYQFREQVLYARLLALLYKCKDVYSNLNARLVHQSGASVLTQRYLSLINNYYLEKRTVDEYAALLNITPGHLGDMVKKATGRPASAFIADKLLQEAKNLIGYTPSDITEIAYQLNFASPAHFNRFFKKQTGQTPLAFRRAFREGQAG